MSEDNSQNSIKVNEELVAKTKAKNKSQRRKTGFYYSFLTIVLLLCVVQVGFGVLINISKIIAYRAKIGTMEKVRDTSEMHNQELKTSINQFSKTDSLEEIARNNLKMAGEDEVLIIISNQEQSETSKSKKHKKNKKANKVNYAGKS